MTLVMAELAWHGDVFRVEQLAHCGVRHLNVLGTRCEWGFKATYLAFLGT